MGVTATLPELSECTIPVDDNEASRRIMISRRCRKKFMMMVMFKKKVFLSSYQYKPTMTPGIKARKSFI